MLLSTGNHGRGVGRRVPVISLMASCSSESTRLV